MKILYAASEAAPYAKSGGLADVAFSLPPALKRSGDEIAIITPLYNGEKYVAQTIESVLAQTYPDWEMIVVNDGSGSYDYYEYFEYGFGATMVTIK